MLASPSVKKKDARSALEIHGELLPGLFALSDAVLQKGSVVTGVLPLEITTSVEQWAYAVLFPLRAEAARETANRFFLVTVEAEVMSGRIGIGYIARDGSTYLATEIERVAEAEDSSINLFLGPREVDEGGWLVVRNTAGDGRPSKVMLRSIRTFQTNATRIPDFTEVDPPALPCKLAQPGREISCEGGKDPGRNRRARKFRVLVTHTSRSWDWKRCSRDFLRQRVSDPKRLSGLPAFELLPGYQGRLYSGGMTLLDVDVDENEVRGAAQRCVDSRFKIQHATVIGQRLVVCFEDFLAAFPEPDVPLSDIDLSPGSPWRVDDNWFGGFHTVFPVDSDVCMVSSSGADAVLWVDLRLRKVVRRWRLPQEIYGFNYGLTPEMSVVDHYIHNDIQL